MPARQPPPGRLRPCPDGAEKAFCTQRTPCWITGFVRLIDYMGRRWPRSSGRPCCHTAKHQIRAERRRADPHFDDAALAQHTVEMCEIKLARPKLPVFVARRDRHRTANVNEISWRGISNSLIVIFYMPDPSPIGGAKHIQQSGSGRPAYIPMISARVLDILKGDAAQNL